MKPGCASFVSILNTIHEEGINTREALTSNQDLYSAFWFAAREFVTCALRSKTSGKDRNGEIRVGNADKIKFLVAQGVATSEDIHMDCVIRIIEKLDYVLNQPVEKEKNYCYKIVNNKVNDLLRKLPPVNTEVSLQETIKGNRMPIEDNSTTYEDIIGDNTYNAEELHIRQETISELNNMLKEKQSKAFSENRSAIIREIAALSKRPEEMLAHLACVYCKIKPRELAARLVTRGCKDAFDETLRAISKEYDITDEELCALLADVRIAGNAIKADTKDPGTVAKEISRVLYKAKKRLN